jgi:hypothetical protein
VRVGAALTTPGRVGTARRRGSGQRDEKVYARNQCLTPLNGPPAQIWRIWAGRGTYPTPLCGKAGHMAKGASRSVAEVLEYRENAGEYE